jgi:hypothetical protein
MNSVSQRAQHLQRRGWCRLSLRLLGRAVWVLSAFFAQHTIHEVGEPSQPALLASNCRSYGGRTRDGRDDTMEESESSTDRRPDGEMARKPQAVVRVDSYRYAHTFTNIHAYR